MSDLVSRFIEFTALVERKKPLQSCAVPVPLTSLVQMALTSAAGDIEASGLEVIDEVQESPHTVVVIPDKVAQCFQQLIENACKFAGRGSSLTIRCRQEEQQLVLEFADDGPGIPPWELQRVFRLFHQLDREGTGEVPGAGMGLWWTREIVRIHGGDVRLKSPATKDGRGLVVEVALPMRLVSAGSESAERVEACAPTEVLDVPLAEFFE